jgi:hypothetical protein
LRTAQPAEASPSGDDIIYGVAVSVELEPEVETMTQTTTDG